MIPYPGKTLSDLAMRIATDIAPATHSNFAQADSGLITGLLLGMAQDYERAVYNCMTDIEEIKALCREVLGLNAEALAQFGDHAACESFLDAQPDTLLLSDVTTLHARALELLIDVHSWAEAHNPAIDAAVWQLLRRHSERHKLELPGP